MCQNHSYSGIFVIKAGGCEKSIWSKSKNIKIYKQCCTINLNGFLLFVPQSIGIMKFLPMYKSTQNKLKGI